MAARASARGSVVGAPPELGDVVEQRRLSASQTENYESALQEFAQFTHAEDLEEGEEGKWRRRSSAGGTIPGKIAVTKELKDIRMSVQWEEKHAQKIRTSVMGMPLSTAPPLEQIEKKLAFSRRIEQYMKILKAQGPPVRALNQLE